MVGGVWALALWGAALAAGGTHLRGRAPAASRRLGHEEIDYDYYYDNFNDGLIQHVDDEMRNDHGHCGRDYREQVLCDVKLVKP